MSGSITIELDGKTVAKGRGRAAVVNGRARVFTPASTRSYESALKYAANVAMMDQDPIEGAVRMFVWVYLPIPKALQTGSKLPLVESGEIRPCTKPDIDNYVKSAMDGLNTIVFKDDSQVIELVAVKEYRIKPGIRIEVHPLGAFLKKLKKEDLI